MTERMKTWIKGFAGGVAVTVIVGGIGYFICFGASAACVRSSDTSAGR